MAIIISVDGNIALKNPYLSFTKKQLRWINNKKIIYLQEPVKRMKPC